MPPMVPGPLPPADGVQLREVSALVESFVGVGADVPDALQTFEVNADVLLPGLHRFTETVYTVTGAPTSTLVAQVVLLERLVRKLRVGQLAPRVVHQLWLTCFIVAEKATQDVCFRNLDFANLCELPLSHINKMERHLLTLLDWNCLISEDQYTRVADGIRMLRRSASHGRRSERRRRPTPPETPAAKCAPRRAVTVPTAA
eukprot:TRINITY_DN18732_c0_g1_i1.p1 TRINITY_DN18732_c0_g1~~TRINITY_DN18732_c0_g1_i1.p1  ORF type:complete len:201 (+),score=45.49 TRINITY_DN18732_c0_g1_i1:52-654(+)